MPNVTQRKLPRIIHLIDSLTVGGAERLLVTHLTHFDHSRHEHHVVYLHPPDTLAEAVNNTGAQCHTLNLTSAYNPAIALARLVRLLHRLSPSLLHTHLYFSNIYGRLSRLCRTRIPLITTLHNPDYSNEDTGRVSYQIRKFADYVTGHLFNDRFIAVSDAVRRDYQKHLRFRPIVTLYNSIDPNHVSPIQARDRTRVRQALGIPPDAFVLIQVGRLHPQKGHAITLRAFAQALFTTPTLILLLIGKGRLEPDLMTLAEQLGIAHRVRFLGERNDIIDLLHAADLFVFPSHYEALGIALIEAMAMELPVVASAVDGICEVITHEVDGLLVSPGDAAEFAQHIGRLIASPEKRHKLGIAARQTVLDRFNAGTNARDLEQLYEQLLIQDRIAREV